MNHLRKPGILFRLVLAAVLAFGLFVPLAPAFAQDEKGSVYNQTNSRYFPETKHTVAGPFLDYWNRNGGLFMFGYPISDPFEEVNFDDGKTYTVQYFERNRFEMHPENRGNQYEVLMARFGALLTAPRQGEAPFKAIPAFTSSATRFYLKETSHSLSDGFLDYWNKRGGVAIFGFPISEPFEEISPTDGNKYMVQYFERNRFEYHPENKGTDYEILLGLLGSEFLKNPPKTSPVASAPTSGPAAPTSSNPTTPAPSGSTPTPTNPKKAAVTLNGVALELSTPFLPDQNFVASASEDISQVATSVSFKPFEELSIVNVPFGHKPGTESLPISQPGSQDAYRTALHDYRFSQNGNPQTGPTAQLFGKAVVSQFSLIKLPLDNSGPKTVLVVEWVVEANSSIWIIRVAHEQADQKTNAALLTALNTFSLNSNGIEQHIVTSNATQTDSLQSNVQGDLAFPGVWNGQLCNKGRHPTAYAFGSDASYRGVPACGPRPFFDKDAYGDRVERYFAGAWGVLEWECVELSMRFLYLAYDVKPYGANGSQVVWNYPGNLLQKIANGTAGRAPKPGDILSYGSTASFGHTSVVKASSVDGSGNGSITVMDQNNSLKGVQSLTVKNWRVYAFSTVSGWLSSDSTPPPPPSGSDPVTTLSHTGTIGKNEWLVTTVVVTLTAADKSGTGIEYTEYSFNQTNWTRYTGPFNMPEGSNTVYYRSKDRAGNLEDTNQDVFKVDTKAPSTQIKLHFQLDMMSLSYTITDPTPGSGPNVLHYIARGPNDAGIERIAQTTSTTYPLTGVYYEVEFWGEDIAGNQEVHHIARVVTSTADTDTPGTLRYALNKALDNDTVYFNISGNDPHTIKLTSALPLVKQNNLIIDATSQPGTVCGKELQVVLDGRDKINTGLDIQGKGVSVFGLNLHGFKQQAIWLNNTEGATLECNFIGTNETGTKAIGGKESAEPDTMMPYGIRVNGGAGGHTIGSSEADRGNLVAGDLFTLIKVENSPNNKVLGNTIGTDRDGKKLLGDPEHGEIKQGVVITKGSDNTLVENNLIAGQGTAQLRVNGAANVQIINNLFGTDRTTTKGLGQTIDEPKPNVAHLVIEGGAKAALVKNNVFSSYNYRAIMVADKGSDETRIEGNFIGVNRQHKLLTRENADLLGTVGIWVKSGPSGTQINGNVLGGLYSGIQITGKTTGKTIVKGNFIGTSADGKAKLRNYYGIWIFDGASGNLVTENVITNGEEAVKIGTEPQDTAIGNTISKNTIYGNKMGGTVFADDNYGDGTLNGKNGMANRDAARPNSGLISAKLEGSQLVISGKAKAANFNSTLEVFVSAGNKEFPQGQTYLGTVKANADGSFSLTVAAGELKAGTKLVLSSTLTTGDTSAFSQEVVIK